MVQSSHPKPPRVTSAGSADGPVSVTARTAIDRVLEVFERRGLSPTELRVLLKLLDRDASLLELAQALGQRPSALTRVGRRLSTRGLIRWYHVGARKETRLGITADGLATMHALLAEADLAAGEKEPREITAG
jgi:DNA-binding MarR family transcriptional regulator